MKFEWDPRKARENQTKHGVSFEEALTAFADWDSTTIPDPEHSIGEERFILLGRSSRGNLLVVPHTERGEYIRIIVRGTQTRDSEDNMRKSNSSKSETVPDYDFSNGVRGKYAARFREGTNVVILSPDVAEIFPDSQAVNEALRTLVRMSGKTVRMRATKKARGA